MVLYQYDKMGLEKFRRDLHFFWSYYFSQRFLMTKHKQELICTFFEGISDKIHGDCVALISLISHF